MTTPAVDTDEQRLVEARDRVNTLVLKAEALEAKARRARRRAKSAQLHYQALLAKRRGEQPLPFTFDSPS